MWIRDAFEEDAAELATIFWRAVREGAAPAYSAAEREAWAPTPPTAETWSKRLNGLETVVADDGPLLGFMSMAPGGYLDLAFVLPEWRGKGVSERLYAVLEGRARAKGQAQLRTHASLLAQPFFARHDWSIVRPDPVKRGAATLQRYEMEKRLS